MNADILNSDLEWNRLSPTVRGAFAGSAAKCHIRTGTWLYRFGADTSIRSKNGGIVPWWLPQTTVDEIRRLHRDTGLTFEEVVRAVAGISLDFQTACNWELRGRLMVPAFGFKGMVARKPLLNRPASSPKLNPDLHHLYTLDAYCEQWYIPNLTAKDVSVARWLLKKGFSTILT